MKTVVLWLCAVCCCILNVEAEASCPDGCNCEAYENTLFCHTFIDTMPLVTATNMSSTYLYVTYNKRLTRVDKNRLISSNLTYVHLDNNQISHIVNDAFVHIRNTSVLSISNNRLTAITSKVFAPLVKLKFLDLSHNPIHSIADDAFEDLKTLSLLDVSDTLLTSLRFVVSIVTANQDNAYLLRVNASNNQHLKRLDEDTVVMSMRMAELILLNNTNLVCRCKATNVQHLCRMTKFNYRYKWPVFVRTCYKAELMRTMNWTGYHDPLTRQWYEYDEDDELDHDTTVPMRSDKAKAQQVLIVSYLVNLYETNALLINLCVVILVDIVVCVLAYRCDCCFWNRRRTSDPETDENGPDVDDSRTVGNGVARSTYIRIPSVSIYQFMEPGEGGAACYPEPRSPEQHQQQHLHYATPAFPRPVVVLTDKHEYENCKRLSPPLLPPTPSQHDLPIINEELEPIYEKMDDIE